MMADRGLQVKEFVETMERCPWHTGFNLNEHLGWEDVSAN